MQPLFDSKTNISDAYGMRAIDVFRSVRSYLRESQEILASPDDAAFFRSLHAPPKKESAPPKIALPPPRKKPLPPPPAELSAPLIEAPPAFKSPPKAAPKEREETAPPPFEMPKPSSFLRALFQKIEPRLPILDTPPDDAHAKRRAQRWKTQTQIAPISLLFFGEGPAEKALLASIAKAIDAQFGPARLLSAESIEREKQWDAFLSAKELKWVILSDSSLWQLPELLRFYREKAPTASRTLKEVPLFLLPDLSLYLKDPLLKRSLWKALCQKLAPM